MEIYIDIKKCKKNQVYLRWRNGLGVFDSFMFEGNFTDEFRTNNVENTRGSLKRYSETLDIDSDGRLIVIREGLSRAQAKALRSLAVSREIYICDLEERFIEYRLDQVGDYVDENIGLEYIPVTIEAGTFQINTSAAPSIRFTIVLPDRNY